MSSIVQLETISTESLQASRMVTHTVHIPVNKMEGEEQKNGGRK